MLSGGEASLNTVKGAPRPRALVGVQTWCRLLGTAAGRSTTEDTSASELPKAQVLVAPAAARGFALWFFTLGLGMGAAAPPWARVLVGGQALGRRVRGATAGSALELLSAGAWAASTPAGNLALGVFVALGLGSEDAAGATSLLPLRG